MYSMKIQLQYLKSYPQSYAENLIFTYLFRFFFIFHIVSDVVNIYQYAKVYRTTNTGAGASFFPLKCTMCTFYSSIALWSKPEIQKPLPPQKITFFSYGVFGRKLKTCLAFYFLALETLFLEHSKSVQITRKSQICSLMITVSSKIMFPSHRSWDKYMLNGISRRKF